MLHSSLIFCNAYIWVCCTLFYTHTRMHTLWNETISTQRSQVSKQCCCTLECWIWVWLYGQKQPDVWTTRWPEFVYWLSLLVYCWRCTDWAQRKPQVINVGWGGDVGGSERSGLWKYTEQRGRNVEHRCRLELWTRRAQSKIIVTLIWEYSQIQNRSCDLTLILLEQYQELWYSFLLLLQEVYLWPSRQQTWCCSVSGATTVAILKKFKRTTWSGSVRRSSARWRRPGRSLRTMKKL